MVGVESEARETCQRALDRANAKRRHLGQMSEGFLWITAVLATASAVAGAVAAAQSVGDTDDNPGEIMRKQKSLSPLEIASISLGSLTVGSSAVTGAGAAVLKTQEEMARQARDIITLMDAGSPYSPEDFDTFCAVPAGKKGS